MASEYLKWKYRDVRPDAPVERTKKQKAANWWQYHKWWLLVGALLILALIDIGGSVLGIGKVAPDYQLAYAGSGPLDEGALAALEQALAVLGEDCNGDGRVTVRLNAYPDMSASQDSDAARYTQAAKIKLMADLESCESCLFILNDPETFHTNYQVLARADGELAEFGDEALFYRWEDCPALASLDVPQEAFAGLYIARRGFWQDRVCQYKPQCDALWDALTEGAKS